MITKFQTSTTPAKGGSNMMVILGGLALLGLGYYFFIYKPAQEARLKKSSADGTEE